MKKLAQVKKKLYLCAQVFAQTQENCLVKGEKHNEMTKPLHTISSNANIHVFGTTGAASSSPSTGGWSSLSNKKTASFSTIQQEVIQTVTYSPGHTHKAYNPNEGTLYPNSHKVHAALPSLDRAIAAMFRQPDKQTLISHLP